MKLGTLPARESGLFLDPEMNIRSVPDVQVSPRKRERKVAHKHRSSKKKTGLVDAIIDGERVLLATEPEPLEKGIQLQILTALSAAGIRVLPHRIYPCPSCGTRPPPSAGLGKFCADVICVVPPYGRFCAIEVKRPSTRNAKRDAGQREWAKWIRHYGGVAGVATNIDEAFDLIAMARRLP